MSFRIIAICMAGLLAMAGMAQAEGNSMTIGQVEYMNSCAQCHGADGKGDGPMAGVLKNGAPDLTQLQKNNGGVFPVSTIYALISGKGLSGAHGSSEMPAWGFRYKMNAPAMVGPYGTAADEKAFVEGRILGLVEYISTLQAK